MASLEIYKAVKAAKKAIQAADFSACYKEDVEKFVEEHGTMCGIVFLCGRFVWGGASYNFLMPPTSLVCTVAENWGRREAPSVESMTWDSEADDEPEIEDWEPEEEDDYYWVPDYDEDF